MTQVDEIIARAVSPEAFDDETPHAPEWEARRQMIMAKRQEIAMRTARDVIEALSAAGFDVRKVERDKEGG